MKDASAVGYKAVVAGKFIEKKPMFDYSFYVSGKTRLQ